MELSIEAIRLDGGTQPRAAIDKDVIQDYALSMMEGVKLPPVTVFYDGTDYWLADGFHRYHASRQMCQDTIEADVRQGTRRDAVLYSVGANATHGLRRTNADKRRAVETLLNDAEWAKWNDSEIARRTGTSHDFTRRLRPATILHSMQDSPRLVERNGTTYTMNTATIGRPQEQQNLTPTQFFDEITPGFTDWQQNEDEETEADRSQRSVDLGLTEYYHDDLRRAAFRRDEESRYPLKTVPDMREFHPILNTVTSKSNEWYTPSRYVQAAREVMGNIDLDPASNPTANEVIQAATYYDKETNGLDKEWAGRVWMNPPYGRDETGSNQDIWTRRLIDHFNAGAVTEAVVLVNASVDTRWFQPLWDFPICFPDHRINFYTSDSIASGSTHGSALVYLGHNEEKFKSVFKQFGPIVRKVS